MADFWGTRSVRRLVLRCLGCGTPYFVAGPAEAICSKTISLATTIAWAWGCRLVGRERINRLAAMCHTGALVFDSEHVGVWADGPPKRSRR